MTERNHQDSTDSMMWSDNFSHHSTISSSTNSNERKDSMSWAASEDILNMISHTPPAFSPGSLELPKMKRNRSGSISGRLRSASDLEERGMIDRYQKKVLKDLIISGDSALREALEKYQKGDSSAMEALMDSGALNNRKGSLDLLDDLDFGFLNVGSLGTSPRDGIDTHFGAAPHHTSETLEEWDDLRFESAFVDITNKNTSSRNPHDQQHHLNHNSSYHQPYHQQLHYHHQPQHRNGSFTNSLPSMGMGVTPPNPFGLTDQFLEKHTHTDNDYLDHRFDLHHDGDNGENVGDHVRGSGMSGSRPIGIPGASPSNGKISNEPLTPKTYVGAYSPESRRKRVEKFLEKRHKRVWTKKVKYDVRKNFADSRLRVKGRFVKKEDEQLLRELLSLT